MFAREAPPLGDAVDSDEVQSWKEEEDMDDEDIALVDQNSSSRLSLLSNPSTLPRHRSFGCLQFVFVFCFVVAVIIGSGILGLPIECHKSGFFPFLVIFSITMCITLLLANLIVDVLVWTQSTERFHTLRLVKDEARPSFRQHDSSSHEAADHQLGDSLHFISPGPSFHDVAECLIGSGFWSRLFDILFLVGSVVFLSSYTLAGSQSFGDLFHLPRLLALFLFWGIFTTFTLFGQRIIEPIISFITLFKGSALVVLVAVLGYVSTKMDVTVQSNFSYMGQPWMIGIVALSCFTIIPVLYGMISPSPQNITRLRWAIGSAIVFCYAMNIAWVYFVLHIVPSSSLEKAFRNGDIATEPILHIIRNKHPDLMWASSLVSVFIAVSVSAAYISSSLALKHVLDGLVKERNLSLIDAHSQGPSLSDSPLSSHSNSPSRQTLISEGGCSRCWKQAWTVLTCPCSWILFASATRFQIFLYVVCFSFPLGLALLDPSGFLVFISAFGGFITSFLMGVMIPSMTGISFNREQRSILSSGESHNDSPSRKAQEEETRAFLSLPSSCDQYGIPEVHSSPTFSWRIRWGWMFILTFYALACSFDLYSVLSGLITTGKLRA